MALIKCPECGKEISDKSKTCVNCGCPIAEENSEVVANVPNTITIVEDKKTSAQKKFFISMILNAIGTAIPTFIVLSLLVNQETHDVIEHESDAAITITVESLTEIISTFSFRDFLADNPIFGIMPLVFAFVFSLLTYLLKNDKRKKIATGSIIFSIISCLFCIIIASADGCGMLLLIPSGVLFVVSALMTVLGMKEYLNK